MCRPVCSRSVRVFCCPFNQMVKQVSCLTSAILVPHGQNNFLIRDRSCEAPSGLSCCLWYSRVSRDDLLLKSFRSCLITIPSIPRLIRGIVHPPQTVCYMHLQQHVPSIPPGYRFQPLATAPSEKAPWSNMCALFILVSIRRGSHVRLIVILATFLQQEVGQAVKRSFVVPSSRAAFCTYEDVLVEHVFRRFFKHSI